MPSVEGIKHYYVEANGMRFHLAEAGRGEPIVLLHTFPQHWYAWRYVIPELAKTHTVYCLDMRGAGWSDAPDKGYDTATRVQDVLAVLDALRLPQVTLVGHGWGAWTGYFVCLEAPDRIKNFIAMSMIHPWAPCRQLVYNAWRYWHTAFWEYPFIGRQVLRHFPGLTKGIICHWMVDKTMVSSEALDSYASSLQEPARASAGQALNWCYVLRDIPSFVRGRFKKLQLKVPTVLVIGERDAVVTPAMVRGGANTPAMMSVRVVPGAGHLLPEEQPAKVAAIIQDFLINSDSA